MKRWMIAAMMVLALMQTAGAAAQKHRHSHPATVVTDTVLPPSDAPVDEVEAFSDTTAVDSVGQASGRTYSYGVVQDDDDLADLLNGLPRQTVAAAALILAIVMVVFVLAPVLIIVVVFYFMRKNRKDRMRMAEMAMKSGQPIPQELLRDGAPTAADDNEELRQKGMRQTFLGLGLMVFLGYTAGEIGFGIGVLVLCIGLGKLVIVKTSRKDQAPDDPANLRP